MNINAEGLGESRHFNNNEKLSTKHLLEYRTKVGDLITDLNSVLGKLHEDLTLEIRTRGSMRVCISLGAAQQVRGSVKVDCWFALSWPKSLCLYCK